MEELFIPYELALKLRKLGFDKLCFKTWIDNGVLRNEESINSKLNKFICSAPLWDQAFNWIRKNKGLCVFINYSGGGYCSGWEDPGHNEHGFNNYETYEQARETVLQKLIESCKEDAV